MYDHPLISLRPQTYGTAMAQVNYGGPRGLAEWAPIEITVSRVGRKRGWFEGKWLFQPFKFDLVTLEVNDRPYGILFWSHDDWLQRVKERDDRYEAKKAWHQFQGVVSRCYTRPPHVTAGEINKAIELLGLAKAP